MPSMVASDAASEPAGARKEHTYARDAEHTTTVPSTTRPKPRWKVVTPLKVDAWRYYLGKHGLLADFGSILDGLTNGFTLNSSLSIEWSRIYDNHKSATDHPDVIDSAIEKEVNTGRYEGPFTRSELEDCLGPFISHPLGLVPKQNGKWRVIEDLSFPRGHSSDSINSTTDISDIPVDWGGLAEVIELVVTAREGAQCATVDWGDAFRNIPIDLSEVWSGVVQWKHFKTEDEARRFYADKCSKFGHARSMGNFGLVNKGFTTILMKEGYGYIIFWVDDILIRREPLNPLPPWRYSFGIDDILQTASNLGVPLPSDKIQPFSTTFRYLGFVFNLESKIVEVSEEKKTKGKSKIADALHDQKISLDSLRSLTGFLSHLALVILPGKAHLRSLFHMQAEMERKGAVKWTRWVWPDYARSDLVWWASELEKDFLGMKLCTMRKADDSLGVFVDASTDWGIGIVIQNEFDRFRLVEGWREGTGESRDIGWAEFVAVELAVFFLISSFNIHNRHILIHSDNKGVVLAWKARRSRSTAQNAVLLRVLHLLNSRSCFLSLDYVSSSLNPADGPSRGFPAPNCSRVKFKGFPSELRGLLVRE